MSWKVHGTDEVFAALRGLCSNSYRMYDPCEYRYYYDHECDAYECVVEDAAEEYERLLKHCTHQREQLAKLTRYVQGEAPSETIDLLMELLNEYRESECAIDESRVSWYARRLGGRTMNERMTNDERTSGAGITDGLREAMSPCISDDWLTIPKSEFETLADRIDAVHAVKVERLEKYRAAVDAMLKEYVKLPVDADGVPIHVGDVMEWSDGSTFDVVGISANTLFYVEHDFDDSAQWTAAHNKRHHKPDSWEGIIADAFKFAGNGGVPVGARFADYTEEFVERCRRLAGADASSAWNVRTEDDGLQQG